MILLFMYKEYLKISHINNTITMANLTTPFSLLLLINLEPDGFEMARVSRSQVSVLLVSGQRLLLSMN